MLYLCATFFKWLLNGYFISIKKTEEKYYYIHDINYECFKMYISGTKSALPMPIEQRPTSWPTKTRRRPDGDSVPGQRHRRWTTPNQHRACPA